MKTHGRTFLKLQLWFWSGCGSTVTKTVTGKTCINWRDATRKTYQPIKYWQLWIHIVLTCNEVHAAFVFAMGSLPAVWNSALRCECCQSKVHHSDVFHLRMNYESFTVLVFKLWQVWSFAMYDPCSPYWATQRAHTEAFEEWEVGKALIWCMNWSKNL